MYTLPITRFLRWAESRRNRCRECGEQLLASDPPTSLNVHPHCQMAYLDSAGI